ncbi:hypothetical protein VIGAN_11181200 [Vigna angularis var. angularis]|uniref:Uncharacterized protein n=1 Tax=Vigna angularis var. angularis TaxID=157739 RepID=A0A0S3TAR7_PHAAN|nr:hypothetical protein VIGAN_11181200 [Vigna angularis var. angularis]
MRDVHGYGGDSRFFIATPATTPRMQLSHVHKKRVQQLVQRSKGRSTSSCRRRALSRLGKVFTPNTLKKAAAPVMSSKMKRKPTSKLVHTEERSSCTSTHPPFSLSVHHHPTKLQVQQRSSQQ